MEKGRQIERQNDGERRREIQWKRQRVIFVGVEKLIYADPMIK